MADAFIDRPDDVGLGRCGKGETAPTDDSLLDNSPPPKTKRCASVYDVLAAIQTGPPSHLVLISGPLHTCIGEGGRGDDGGDKGGGVGVDGQVDPRALRSVRVLPW
jgi:hypothetical protein